MKLKGVEIEAFRGYKDKVNFDFLTSGGGIANIIAIYAPNGFGKTSFFDAIEWGFKNKINRFEAKLLNQAAKQSSNLILRHIGSDIPGTVKCIDAENNFFLKRTKTTKNGDYISGIVDSSTTSKLKNLIKTDNPSLVEILPQNAVDEFVYSTSPEDRYKALMGFWDGYEDTKHYQGIAELFECNKEEIHEQKLRIGLKEKEINDLASSEATINLFSEIIRSLNSIDIFETKLSEIEPRTSQEEFEILKTKYVRTKIHYENNLNEEQAKADKINLLFSDSNDYFKNTKEIVDFNKQLTYYRDIKNKFVEKERLSNQHQYTDVLNSLTFELNALQVLNLNRDSYLAVIQRINNAEDEKKTLIEDNIVIANKLAKIIQKIQNIETKGSVIKKEVEDKQNFLNSINSFHLLSAKANNTLIFAQKRLRLARKLLVISEKNYNAYSSPISNAFQTLSLKPEDLLNAPLLEKNQDKQNKLKEIWLKNKELKEDLKKLEDKYFKSGSLNENLKKIIDFGKNYISETETTRCPLCNIKHNSFHILLEQIKTQKEDVLGLEQLNGSIQSIKENIESCGQLFEVQFKALINNLQEDYNILQDEQNKCLKKIFSINKIITYYDSIITVSNTELSQLKDTLNLHSLEFSSIEQLAAETKQKIEIENNELVKLTATLDKYQETFYFLQTQQKNNNLKINQVETTLVGERNSEVIKIISSALKNALIDTKSFEELGVEKILASTLQKIEKTKKQQQELADKIEKLTFELNQYRETECNLILQNIEYRISLATSAIKEYELNLFSVISREESNNILQKLTELNVAKEKRIADFKLIISYVSELLTNLNLIESNIKLQTTRAELEALEKRLIQLNEVHERLSALKEEVKAYIDDKVNRVFNQEIINDIYQKIDPHPELKHIKLELEFESVKPKLSIKAQNLDGSNIIDPVLYLSSAQINILSLSIFLAKALQNKDACVNTIFMDDPIQYLDSINILSFLDLIRIVISDPNHSRQVVLSTHDENFFKLLKKKFNPDFYAAKFIEFETYGKLKAS